MQSTVTVTSICISKPPCTSGDPLCCGWKKAGISGLLDGTTVLPPEDPFENITVD